MKKLILLLIFVSNNIIAQERYSNVQFEGNRVIVLEASENEYQVSGKLTTGENITTGCSHGACFFKIEYKSRIIEESIGDDITSLTVYEFDFNGDGDNQIVVVNDFMETSYLFIYNYGRGVIEKILEREIANYKIVIKKDYVEFYLPSGLAWLWNYYMGCFWEMNSVKIK